MDLTDRNRNSHSSPSYLGCEASLPGNLALGALLAPYSQFPNPIHARRSKHAYPILQLPIPNFRFSILEYRFPNLFSLFSFLLSRINVLSNTKTFTNCRLKPGTLNLELGTLILKLGTTGGVELHGTAE
jgi:hypothetical protein